MFQQQKKIAIFGFDASDGTIGSPTNMVKMPVARLKKALLWAALPSFLPTQPPTHPPTSTAPQEAPTDSTPFPNVVKGAAHDVLHQLRRGAAHGEGEVRGGHQLLQLLRVLERRIPGSMGPPHGLMSHGR